MQNYKRSHNLLEMGIWIQLIRIRFPHPNELNTKNLNVDFFGGQYLAKSLIFGHKCHFRCKKSMGQCVLYMQIFAFSFCRVERLLLNLFTVCIRFVRNQPSLLRTPKTQMFSWMTSLTKSKVFGV